MNTAPEPAPADVLVTGEISKLDAFYQRLLDPAVPVPDGVRYFSEKLTWSGIIGNILIGLGLVVAGLTLVALGLVFFVFPIVGLVFLFAAGVVLLAQHGRIRAMKQQQSGADIRYGVFLGSQTIFMRTSLDYTVIPLDKVSAVAGRKLYYHYQDKTKSLNLPEDLTNADTVEMLAAVETWQRNKSSSG